MRGLATVLLLGLLAACPERSAPAPADEPQAEPASQDDTPALPEASDASGEICCSQCLEAASKDPAGMDLALVPCSEYGGYVVNGAAVLSEACAEWFTTQPIRVQDCRTGPKRVEP